MIVEVLKAPTEEDWMEVKRRALVTVGKKPVKAPDDEWKMDILNARHSPIRYLTFSFYLEVPYWVSVHLCRHIHAQPYVKSQRNDRQAEYDRNSAPQNQTVCMIWDMNAEELINIANKRLCRLAADETREVAEMIRDKVLETNPEFEYALVPMCVRENGCHEMFPCNNQKK